MTVADIVAASIGIAGVLVTLLLATLAFAYRVGSKDSRMVEVERRVGDAHKQTRDRLSDHETRITRVETVVFPGAVQVTKFTQRRNDDDTQP